MKNIALYLRLSHADADLGKGNKDESNSIENQRGLLRHFLEAKDDIEGEVVEYVDDGYSGTNFDRPSFKRMVDDAKAGKIGVVIVKDLSRFGREYIGVGDYLEQIFPSLGVRFIAVNSNYDSNNHIGNTLGIDTTITNLMNSLYSKDLSKKIRSARIAKWKSGTATASNLPFGYTRDLSRSKTWAIDEDAAEIVRTVFKKAAKGWTTKEITEYLNKNNIPTPLMYARQSKVFVPVSLRSQATDHEIIWDTAKVWRMLRNFAYTGSVVHGKNTRIIVGANEQRRVPDNERYVVENVNPPIVSKETFYKAQECIAKQKQKEFIKGKGDLLTGKVKCGNCHLAMCYKGLYERYLFCQHATISGSTCTCLKKDYQAKMIEGYVKYALRNQLNLLLDLGNQLQTKTETRKCAVKEKKKEIEQRLEYLQAEKIRQYEAFASGNTDREKYIAIKSALGEEYDRLNDSLSTIETQNERVGNIVFAINRVESKADRLFEKGELTREMVDAFIDVIYVHDSDKIEVVMKMDDLISKVTEELNRE